MEEGKGGRRKGEEQRCEEERKGSKDGKSKRQRQIAKLERGELEKEEEREFAG